MPYLIIIAGANGSGKSTAAPALLQNAVHIDNFVNADVIAQGYQFHLIFLWLKTEKLAVSRVQERIQMGGHSVPESTIRRRYHAGLKNFFNLSQKLS